MDITTPTLVSEILTGFFAALLGYLQGAFRYITSLFIVQMSLTDDMRFVMAHYCWNNLRRRGPSSSHTYRAQVQFVRPQDRWAEVAFETLGSRTILFWDGWRPLFVKAPSSGGESGMPSSETDLEIRFLRGTFTADGLIQRAVDVYNQASEGGAHRSKKSRYRVKRYGGYDHEEEHSRPRRMKEGYLVLKQDRVIHWKPEDLGSPVSVLPAIERLALSPQVVQAIEGMRRWYRSEKWYKEHHIPWRLGWLLHGPPGTGKSSLASAVAQELDIPIHLFDLTTMDNNDFLTCWRSVLNDTPALVLMEDFHAVFNKQEPVAQKTVRGLSFDCILNALSGVEGCDGIFTIITTNNIERIDPSLGILAEDEDGNPISSRPGRMDHILELSYLDESGRRKIAERVLASCPHLIEKLVIQGEGDTGAQFQERCTSVALREFWKMPSVAVG